MISTQWDDWLNEEKVRSPLFYAELSSGEIAIQDDGHPDRQGSAWLRLKQYVKENNLSVQKVWIGFRNESRHFLPELASGYIFVKSLAAIWGSDISLDFYVLGYLEGEVVKCKKIKVPELVLFDEYTRPVDDYSEVLIENILYNVD